MKLVSRRNFAMFPARMRSILLSVIALFSLFTAPARAAGEEAATGEYVIVVGGVSLWTWEKYKSAPHDNWWMNFVRASRIRTQEIQAQMPGTPVTWLVYRPSYLARGRQEKKNLISFIDSVRDAFNVKLVYFDKTQQLIDYLNSGRPRDSVKIVGFEFFGHSNKACFLFDYSSNIDSASKAWLHEDELSRIKRGIFSKNAIVKSWGCHTGESMSRKFKSAVGVPMIGAVGKTQYMTDELPVLSSTGGRWSR